MTEIRDRPTLSNLELIVLVRLSRSTGANEDEIAAGIAELAPPDVPPSARERAIQTLAVLRRGLLATDPRPTKRSPQPRTKLTEEGKRALRATLQLDAIPTWAVLRDRYIPALALGVRSQRSDAAKLATIEGLACTVLRQHFGIPQATTVIALCDQLIARALGFTGPVTMLRLRAHVLAHGLGLDPTVTSSEDLTPLALRAASKSQDPAYDGKRSLRQVLGRRWTYRVTAKVIVSPAPEPAGGGTASVSPPVIPPRPTAALEVTADALLMLVREAIARIGADGRFGDEKVFVSAIWSYIKNDGRMPSLSLERFKGWLVIANREQLLDLARADALGDMDGQLVEDSEIRDLGSTFHFVVDRRAVRGARGAHA